MDRDLCVSHEESVLASLQHLEHVPKVVASHKSSSSCPPTLILRPNAFRFSAFEMSHEEVLNLNDTLFAAHNLNIVHRDIRIPNMFKTGEGKILLNDWGAAEYIGAKKESFGSFTDEDESDTYAVIDNYPGHSTNV